MQLIKLAKLGFWAHINNYSRYWLTTGNSFLYIQQFCKLIQIGFLYIFYMYFIIAFFIPLFVLSMVKLAWCVHERYICKLQQK